MEDLNPLIDELLKRELRPNTREDLAAWRKEIAAGTLSAGDARYIRALHARVVAGKVPAAKKIEDEDGQSDAEPSEIERLQAALADAKRREEALAAERDTLQAAIADLRRELDALKASKG
jgi:uncharacterized protein YlxW (UPF0749 family)